MRMTNDLISKQALLEAIGKFRCVSNSMTLLDRDFIDLINSAPVVNGEAEWISVDDRLPEFGAYIVTLESGFVTEFNFSNIGENRWFKLGHGDEKLDNNVTHWKPFPIRALINESEKQ